MTPLKVLFIAVCFSFATFVACAENFSFIIIADPHIDGNSDRETILRKCVDWINNNKADSKIEFVCVVGDIGWGEAMSTAKSILDRLTVPYVPIIGDNEIQFGCEKQFDTVFNEQYAILSRVFDNWSKAPTPVWNPQVNTNSYLQNFSFDCKGVHFVCLDFASRVAGDESAELNNYQNGTWPWFKNDVTNCAKTRKENIVVLSHFAMFRGWRISKYTFSSKDMDEICRFIYNYRNYIDSSYGGHLHRDWTQTVYYKFRRLYTARVVDATWDDLPITMRKVTVTTKSWRNTYSQENIVVE